MPEDTKQQEVKFAFRRQARIKRFAYPASTTPLPSRTLSKFLSDIGTAFDVKGRVDVISYEDQQGMTREICRGQSDEFYEFWKIVKSTDYSKKPMDMELYQDCEWLPEAPKALERWTEEMRRQGVTQQEMDGFHPGLSIGKEEEEEEQEAAPLSESRDPTISRESRTPSLATIGYRFLVDSPVSEPTLSVEVSPALFADTTLDDFKGYVTEWLQVHGVRMVENLSFNYIDTEVGLVTVETARGFDGIRRLLELDARVRQDKVDHLNSTGSVIPYRPKWPEVEVTLNYVYLSKSGARRRFKGKDTSAPYGIEKSLNDEYLRYEAEKLDYLLTSSNLAHEKQDQNPTKETKKLADAAVRAYLGYVGMRKSKSRGLKEPKRTSNSRSLFLSS